MSIRSEKVYYSHVKFKHYDLKTDGKNSYCLVDETVVKINEIYHEVNNKEEVYVVGSIVGRIMKYYDTPCAFSIFSSGYIEYAQDMKSQQSFLMSQITCKGMTIDNFFIGIV